jgi:hypothetical protein
VKGHSINEYNMASFQIFEDIRRPDEENRPPVAVAPRPPRAIRFNDENELRGPPRQRELRQRTALGDITNTCYDDVPRSMRL